MSLFKKMVLISDEEYRQLKNSKSNMNLLTQGKADTNELVNAYSDMKDALENDSLPEDVKADKYTKSLNHFDTFKQKVEHRRLFPENQFQTKSDVVNKDALDDYGDMNGRIHQQIMDTVPKTYQKQASLLLNHINKHSNIIRWNDKGEVVHNGNVLPQSNIVDLVTDLVRNRVKSQALPYKDHFIQILHEINTPSEWMKNRKRSNSNLPKLDRKSVKKEVFDPSNWISKGSIQISNKRCILFVSK